jgi:biopolymer transport protein ExbD
MLIRNIEAEGDLHIDFVPMVDVLFNLLIFFLLATTLHQTEREMQIALPQTRIAGPLTAAPREIVINVDAAGGIVVAGRRLGDEDLLAMLRSATAANPAQKVSLRGDRAAPYASIAHVLDLCKAAGITEPYLATVPTGGN